MSRVSLSVSGMTCQACVCRVSDALSAVVGAEDVHVDLVSEKATLTFPNDPSLLISAVASVGKKASLISDSPAHQVLSPSPPPPAPSAQHHTLTVTGMTCQGCVGRVRDALKSVSGAVDVFVDLESKRATVVYPGPTDHLIAAVAAVGKQATLVSPIPAPSLVTLRVEGMTCQGCVRRVTQALESIPTALNVNVDLTTSLATLTVSASSETLVEAVREVGKVATIVDAPYDVEQLVDVDVEEDSLVDLSLSSSPAKEEPPDSVEEEEAPWQQLNDMGKDTMPVSTSLRVSGMTCSSCVGVVEGVLMGINGVTSARVNLLAGRATVLHHEKIVSTSELAEAVHGAGYRASVINLAPDYAAGETVMFRIEFPTDMQAQQAFVVLRSMEGVDSVQVISCLVCLSLKSGFAKASILRALEMDGSFGKMIVRGSVAAERAELAMGENQGATDVIDEEARMWRGRFFLSLSFFVPILLLSFVQGHSEQMSMRFAQWVQLLLATPVQFICGGGFYRASYYALKKGRATMDVLIALSTSIAYFSSVVVVLFDLGKEGGSMTLGHAAMFKVSAMIITMVLVGKWLEASAKRKAAAGVAALSSLAPEKAVIYDEKDEMCCHTEISVKLLSIGDVVRLIGGDRVPVDGEVIQGTSAVDESMLTGESRAVPKSPGDSVYGGTVNGGGSMLVRTTAIGSDSVLSQIVKLVNDAQTARAPVEAFADAVSAIFVPVVVGISSATFLVWYFAAVFEWIPAEWYAEEGRLFFALLFGLETMVIACPCALGLATPTAVMVATEVGSRMGVLFRGGGMAIEAATKVKRVLFDKTGTLTMGCPEVTACFVSKGGLDCMTSQTGMSVLDAAYAVESQSHHPLAGAVTQYIEGRMAEYAADMGCKVSNVEEMAGRGMQCSALDGKIGVRIGSLSFAFEEVSRNEVLTGDELQVLQNMEDEGLTIVACVIRRNDGEPVMDAAVFGLEDGVREEAAEAVEKLHEMGIETGLVTGDSLECARAVAERTGIQIGHVHGKTLPWTKVSVVEQSRPVCFVGDGINDAPALMAAEVGVAVGAGARVAAEAADVVLVRSDLMGVVTMFHLARATFQRVRLNFCWAIGYNIIAIPVAAGVLYPWFGVRVPAFVASGAMALSSTCVVLSSLALRWYESPVGRRRDGGAVEMEARRKYSADSLSSDGERRDGVDHVPLLHAHAV